MLTSSALEHAQLLGDILRNEQSRDVFIDALSRAALEIDPPLDEPPAQDWAFLGRIGAYLTMMATFVGGGFLVMRAISKYLRD